MAIAALVVGGSSLLLQIITVCLNICVRRHYATGRRVLNYDSEADSGILSGDEAGGANAAAPNGYAAKAALTSSAGQQPGMTLSNARPEKFRGPPAGSSGGSSMMRE